MKKFKPMKVKNSSIKLPDEFLDNLLLNDGDFLVLVEEDGKFYLKKTFESSQDKQEPVGDEQKPPPSMDEMMKKAQEQFSDMPNLGGGDFMKTIESTLNNPDMMKKIQDMAKDMFKGFVDPNAANSSDEDDEEDYEEDDDEDENDDDSAHKIDIE